MQSRWLSTPWRPQVHVDGNAGGVLLLRFAQGVVVVKPQRLLVTQQSAAGRVSRPHIQLEAHLLTPKFYFSEGVVDSSF